MARLPQPGGDSGNWGQILNDFLYVAHNSDGTLQSSALTQAGAIKSGSPAGGDLTGGYPNPSVKAIKGVAISGAPYAGQILTANDSNSASWQTPAADGSFNGDTPVSYKELEPVQAVFIDVIGYESLPSYTITPGPTPTDGVAVADVITANDNGALTVDGYSVQSGDRIAFWQNYPYSVYDTAGIYDVTNPGDGSNPYVLTRSVDTSATSSVTNIFWTAPVLNSNLYGQGLSVRMVPGNSIENLSVLSLISAGGFSTGGGAASGNYSHAEGQAIASGYLSHAEGTSTASDYSAHAEGTSTSSGNYSHAEGTSVADGDFSHSEASGTAHGAWSHAEGSSVANSDYSHAIGVSETHSYGQFAHGSGRIYIDLSQYSRVTGSFLTVNSTPGVLTASWAQPSYKWPDYNRSAVVTARVIGRRVDSIGTVSAWEIKGVIEGDNSSAYRWISGSAPTPSLIAQDAGASAWAVDISLDSANKAINVTVTGEDSKRIHWHLTLELDELS